MNVIFEEGKAHNVSGREKGLQKYNGVLKFPTTVLQYVQYFRLTCITVFS